MSKHVIASKHATGNRGSERKYTIGFILSVTLTLVAYFFVQSHVNSGHDSYSHVFLTVTVLGLALAQLIVQLQFFIHLGHESGPRWNKLAFMFMLLVVFILVGGSIWIMENLHYNMMTPEETDSHMMQKEGIL